MTTIEVEQLDTRDKSSGRVHKRFRIPGVDELTTFEADNLDRAGDYDILDSLDGVDPSDLCKRCYGSRS